MTGTNPNGTIDLVGKRSTRQSAKATVGNNTEYNSPVKLIKEKATPKEKQPVIQVADDSAEVHPFVEEEEQEKQTLNVDPFTIDIALG